MFFSIKSQITRGNHSNCITGFNSGRYFDIGCDGCWILNNYWNLLFHQSVVVPKPLCGNAFWKHYRNSDKKSNWLYKLFLFFSNFLKVCQGCTSISLHTLSQEFCELLSTTKKKIDLRKFFLYIYCILHWLWNKEKGPLFYIWQNLCLNYQTKYIHVVSAHGPCLRLNITDSSATITKLENHTFCDWRLKPINTTLSIALDKRACNHSIFVS